MKNMQLSRYYEIRLNLNLTFFPPKSVGFSKFPSVDFGMLITFLPEHHEVFRVKFGEV